MSRKDYVEAARILRETDMPAELRFELVSRFVTMFADDNARFSSSRFREAAMPAQRDSSVFVREWRGGVGSVEKRR